MRLIHQFLGVKYAIKDYVRSEIEFKNTSKIKEKNDDDSSMDMDEN